MINLLSLCLYFIVYLISAYFLSTKYKNNKAVLILGLLIPIVFAGCRFKVGTDFWQYMNIFERCSRLSLFELLNQANDVPLYRIIAWATYKIGGRILTWSTFAALVIIPFVIVIKKEYEFLSQGTAILIFLLGAFTASFNISKQYIAVVFVFVAMKYVFENKPIKFIILILVATMFHETALIATVVWFLWDHRNNCAVVGRRRLAMILIVAVVVIFYREIISTVSSNMRLYEDFASYANEKTANNRDLIVTAVELFIVLFFWRGLKTIDNRNEFYLSLLVLTFLIGFTGFTHPQVKRIAYYFSTPAVSILFSYLPFCVKEGQANYMKVLIVSFFGAVFILANYILNQANILPYIFDLTTPW